MDRTHAGKLFGGAGVDREDAAVRNCGIDQTRIKHAGEIDVGGVLALAHGLCRTVVPYCGLADIGEFGVGGERRRLVEPDLPLFLLEPVLRDAPDKGFCAFGGVRLWCGSRSLQTVFGSDHRVERHLMPPFRRRARPDPLSAGVVVRRPMSRQIPWGRFRSGTDFR